MWSLTLFYSNLRGEVNMKCRANNWTLADAREDAPVAPRVFTALMQGKEELTLPEFRYLCEWLNISADNLLGLQAEEKAEADLEQEFLIRVAKHYTPNERISLRLP